jgi:hypothetical protein
VARLKDRTLKNVYEQRAQREGGPVLLEAIDQQKIQAVQAALDKLSGITPDGAHLFDQAIDAAKQDLGKYLQGGLKQGIKNLFSDPIAKATTLANAIRAGLSQTPQIAKLYVPKGMENEATKSIWELTPPEKQQQLLATFTKAFKTGFSLANVADLVKGNNMPYVSNLSAAVQELLQNTTPQGGLKMGPQAQAVQEPAPETAAPAAQPGAQTAPTAGQASPTPSAAQANATGTTPTQAPQATSAAKNTVQSQSAQTTQAAQQSKTPTKIVPTDAAAIKDLATYLTKKVGLDQASLEKVLTQLAKDQKLVG